jgi:thiamine pyrophosphate-dependent acetolactate synthase large subunit-like protein
MATAFNDSVPVLHMMNENPVGVRQKGKGYFHDISDQFGIFRAVSGFGHQALLAEEIPAAVHQAMYALLNRRLRPAIVEVAAEAFTQTTDVEMPLLPPEHRGHRTRSRSGLPPRFWQGPSAR